MTTINSQSFTMSGGVLTLKKDGRYGGLCIVGFFEKNEEILRLKEGIQQLRSKGVAFYVVNITTNKDLIKVSRESNTPIVSTPSFIFYLNGDPVAKSKSLSDHQGLMQFAYSCISKIEETKKERELASRPFVQQPQQQFIQKQNFPQKKQHNGGGMLPTPRNSDDINLMEPEGFIPYTSPWKVDSSSSI